MCAITRRLDVLAPVLVDCDHSGGGVAANERKERIMVTTPTVDNAVAWFGAHTVTHHLDCAILQRKRVRVHDVEVR